MSIIIAIIAIMWLLGLIVAFDYHPWSGVGYFVWTVVFPIMLFLGS